MNIQHRSFCLIVFVLLFYARAFNIFEPGEVVAEMTAEAQGQKAAYVCPPCGCGSDHVVLDKPGSCAACGMELVVKGSPANQPPPPMPQAERKRVAILIFDGVQIIDYAGPYEVFGQAGFNVYTVAEKPDAITTAMGMKVVPRYTFEDFPAPNVLLIPGGGVDATQNNPRAIKWIQDTAQKADYVLSVCNGAFLLAKAGLLDGLSATTFYGLIGGLKALAPKTKVVSDKRYVDNGKVITTAGLSSGIDGSLHVISKMLGKGRAQMVALNMEYNWQPDSNYARAAFADSHLRGIFGRALRFDVPEGAELTVLNTAGNTDMWEVNWQAQTTAPAAEILERVNRALADKWSRVDAGKPNASAKSFWKFTDDNGGAWSGAASVQPVPGEKDKLTVTVKIARGNGIKPDSTF
ncbi:MAG TPA: DJ-1/PfpI family protein [Blastocatellia bacterium]|nr:DJ-1/PfpI family protein [Blastocatellia bacterium]